MLGILRKVYVKEFKTKEGKSFKKFMFECDVCKKDNEVVKRTGSYNLDYAKKYFEFCNVKTKDIVNQEVDCLLANKSFKDKDGNTRVYEYIKFLNVLDNNHKPIIMKNAETNNELDF